MKNSNDIFGNRNRDLLACSAVPQPTAPRRVWVRSELNTGFLAEKHEGERPLARPRRGWEYNINVSL